MTGEEIRIWLEREVDGVPPRWEGVDLHEHMVRRTSVAAREERGALVEALTVWLRRCREPETMLAVEMALAHGLVELRSDLHWLAGEVRARRAFLPHYEATIAKAIGALDRTNR